VAVNIDSGRSPSLARLGRVAAAAMLPLAGAGLAYLLSWVSDRLLYIGPFDRAAFGWFVVVPVWALTPLAAAVAWRAIDARDAAWAAAVAGLVISAVATSLFWLAVAFPACDFGAMRTPAESILPSLIVGVVVGAGLAATCLATTAVLRGGRLWSALLVGAGSAVGLVFLAALVATPLILSGGCLRPPV